MICSVSNVIDYTIRGTKYFNLEKCFVPAGRGIDPKRYFLWIAERLYRKRFINFPVQPLIKILKSMVSDTRDVKVVRDSPSPLSAVVKSDFWAVVIDNSETPETFRARRVPISSKSNSIKLKKYIGDEKRFESSLESFEKYAPSAFSISNGFSDDYYKIASPSHRFLALY